MVNNASIRIVNSIGSTLFFTYTLVYYVFTVNKTAVLKMFALALTVILLCVGYIHSTENVDDAKESVGESATK